MLCPTITKLFISVHKKFKVNYGVFKFFRIFLRIFEYFFKLLEWIQNNIGTKTQIWSDVCIIDKLSTYCSSICHIYVLLCFLSCGSSLNRFANRTKKLVWSNLKYSNLLKVIFRNTILKLIRRLAVLYIKLIK